MTPDRPGGRRLLCGRASSQGRARAELADIFCGDRNALRSGWTRLAGRTKGGQTVTRYRLGPVPIICFVGGRGPGLGLEQVYYVDLEGVRDFLKAGEARGPGPHDDGKKMRTRYPGLLGYLFHGPRTLLSQDLDLALQAIGVGSFHAPSL